MLKKIIYKFFNKFKKKEKEYKIGIEAHKLPNPPIVIGQRL
jgi:hypothetical protein